MGTIIWAVVLLPIGVILPPGTTGGYIARSMAPPGKGNLDAGYRLERQISRPQIYAYDLLTVPYFARTTLAYGPSPHLWPLAQVRYVGDRNRSRGLLRESLIH